MLFCVMLKNAEFKRKPEVIAGIFLLLTGISIIVSLLTDIKFLSAFSSLSEDLEYLNESRPILRLNSLIWILTAFLTAISAAAMVSSLVPHQSFLGYLYGLILVLSSVMLCLAGMKGLSITFLMNNYNELELTNPDSLRINISILSHDKDMYLIAA